MTDPNRNGGTGAMRQTPEELLYLSLEILDGDGFGDLGWSKRFERNTKLIAEDRKQAQADILREVLKLTHYPVQVGDEDRIDLIHPGDVLELAKARGLDLEGEDDDR